MEVTERGGVGVKDGGKLERGEKRKRKKEGREKWGSFYGGQTGSRFSLRL